MKHALSILTLAISLSATAASAAQPGQPVPLSDPNGVYCREYTQHIMIAGTKRESYGTACQQEDGAWKIVTTDQPQTEQQVEYIAPLEYISPPRYVVPPMAYYEPYPYYTPYPYYAPYSRINVRASYGRDHHNGHGRGYGHHYRH